MLRNRKFLILVILLAIAVVALVIIKRNADADAKTRERVLSKRTIAEKIYDSKIAKAIEIISGSGIANDHIASSKHDVCYVNSQQDLGGPGFVTVGYTQICFLKYVEIFTTSLDHKSVKDRIKLLPNLASSLDAIEKDRESDYPYCDLYEGKEDSFITPILFRPANSPIKEYTSCDIPAQTPFDFSHLGAISGVWPHIKMYRKFDPQALDNTINQVVLVIDHEYSFEEMGCNYLILCFRPGKPILFAP